MLISVVLPAYNADLYLKEAIDSILAQTFIDFELIVLNDGSTDKTEEIILSYNDNRIVYIKNEKNLGLIATLNKGICFAKGKYIARMDADDICFPERFAKQVEFLEKNQEYVICGTFVYLFIEKIEKKKVAKYPEVDSAIRMRSIFNSPFAHPTVMFRRDIIIDNNLKYSKEYKYAEDYGLWIDLLEYGKGYNLTKPLLYYRITPNSQTAIGNSNTEYRYKILTSIHKKSLESLNLTIHNSGKLFYLSNIARMNSISKDFEVYFDIYDEIFYLVNNKNFVSLMTLGRSYFIFVTIILFKKRNFKLLKYLNIKLMFLGACDLFYYNIYKRIKNG